MKILISGASSGLGAEMARQFADLGHDLVLTAHRVDRMEGLRLEVTTKHPKLQVEVAALDVRTRTPCSTSFARMRRCIA